MFRDIPVLPKSGAGRYLDDVVLDQSEAQEPNSNRVDKTHIPKNFSISPIVVALIESFPNFKFVNLTINLINSDGIMKSK